MGGGGGGRVGEALGGFALVLLFLRRTLFCVSHCERERAEFQCELWCE